MIIIPAVDIKGAKVVRLMQGDFNKETSYSDDPVDVAKKWAQKGAKLLHIVDLDGALAGRPKNLTIIEGIQNGVNIPIEVGGGLRTEESVDRVIMRGISRVVIGTRAYGDEKFIRTMLNRYRERIAVSIDAAGEDVLAEAWTSKTGMNAVDLAKKMESIGVYTIIYTNTLRDGTLKKPDIGLIERMLDAVRVNVIVSGGISSMDDIKDIKKLGRKNLHGVIIGKALYEGRVDLAEAIKVGEGL